MFFQDAVEDCIFSSTGIRPFGRTNRNCNAIKEFVPLKEAKCSSTGLSIGQPGCFIFRSSHARAIQIRVCYFIPRGWNPSDPVMFAMHGVERNAEKYVRSCSELAKDLCFAILCPEFSREHFPDAFEYNCGGVVNSFDLQDPHAVLKPMAPELWSFSFIEHIFDHFKLLSGCRTEGYYLYGHSAGAQFCHRFAAFKDLIMPGPARIIEAFAANAGFWTFPSAEERFPYGLGALPANTAPDLVQFLSTPLHILLGCDDTDESHQHLNRTASAMRQGPHRLARGRSFYDAGVAAAAAAGVPLRWTCEEVPRAGHSNRAMFQSVCRHMSLVARPAAQSNPSLGPPHYTRAHADLKSSQLRRPAATPPSTPPTPTAAANSAAAGTAGSAGPAGRKLGWKVWRDCGTQNQPPPDAAACGGGDGGSSSAGPAVPTKSPSSGSAARGRRRGPAARHRPALAAAAANGRCGGGGC